MMRALFIALSLAVAAPTFAEDAATPKTELALPAITVVKVSKAPLKDVVLTSGLIGAVEEVLVQPQIDGQAIEALEVEVGDKVTEGQVLARLSNTSLVLQKSQLEASRAAALASIAQGEASLIEARSAAEESARVAARTKALASAGSASKSASETANANATSAAARVTVATQGLVAAQAQLTLVDAQIANLDLSLKRTLVTAPVAGEVVERNAMIGAIASGNGAAMFRLVRDGLLELRADVAEQDVMRLAPRQKAVLSVVGLAEPLSGTVRLVEPTVDAATRLGRVRISIDDSTQVRAGLFADAKVMLASRETLSIPVSAVGGSNDGQVALLVSDGVVKQVAITTGIRDGGMIEVLTGLAEGDQVVARAGAFVRDGDHINPVMAETAAISN